MGPTLVLVLYLCECLEVVICSIRDPRRLLEPGRQSLAFLLGTPLGRIHLWLASCRIKEHITSATEPALVLVLYSCECLEVAVCLIRDPRDCWSLGDKAWLSYWGRLLAASTSG